MRKEDLKHQIFTIPNILTYLRIAAIPVFMYFTIAKDTYLLKSAEFPMGFPLIGLIVMVAAASTDLIDGFIARRFNQGSDLGIMLDPFADKLMHVSAILSLVIIGSVHWSFVAIFAFKELCMIIGAFFLANHSKLIKANMLGKVASFTLSIAIFMSYFHTFWAVKVFYLDWIILGIGLVITYCAFANYITQAVKIYKQILQEKKSGGVPDEISGNEGDKDESK